MYHEEDNNNLEQTKPEDHKEELTAPNFVMRDPEPEKAEGREQSDVNQTSCLNKDNYINQEAVSGRSDGYGNQSSQGGYNGQGNLSGRGGYNGQGNLSDQSGYNGQGNSSGQSGYNSQGGYQDDRDGCQYQGSSPYTTQQNIPHYQEHQYQRMAQVGPIPAEPKPKKEKSGFWKKAICVVSSALVFGVVAGSTMVGINWAAGAYGQKQSVEISQAETVAPADTTAASDSGQTAVLTNTSSNLDVSAIVDKGMPSVVAITSKVIYESQTWFGPMQREGVGSGSGIIVGQNNDELLIVTNNHVVEGAEELKVTFIDKTPVDAAIKGTDAESDLAVIAVPLSSIPSDTQSQITIAKLGNSDDVKVGQGVVAIGNALGYGQAVTVGYISALDRTVQTEDGTSRDLLQTDAAINPGNSGGALLNMQGEVIGINSAKYSSTEVEGMGYAIPISKAQTIIDTLMTRKTRTQIAEERQGYLGIQCKNIDASMSQQLGMPQGVFIFKIVEGGAASKSDLREKDIITKFDGQSVRTYDDLTNMLKFYEGGTAVTLTVQSLEDGQYVERNVEVTLDKRPVETSQS